MQVVLRWPIREGLLAYVAHMQEEAMVEFRLQRIEYLLKVQLGGTKKVKPPRPPPILLE